MDSKLHFKNHKCMLSTKRKKRCQNAVLRSETGNHTVIQFQGEWAELCRMHFALIFKYLITQGVVATNEVECMEE